MRGPRSATLGDFMTTPSRQESKKPKSASENTIDSITEEQMSDSTKNEAMQIDMPSSSNNETNNQTNESGTVVLD